ncbi:hypothetical protein F2P56_015687 [Juglans regia]|uniref:40S ribosomal protein S18 n=1 Tax=Juglans regia TaxID=51240 RepID=A0A833XGP0_JUGRE|nr:hypothetical protein F2P56_015687 [Juglans regia]
MQLYFGTSFIVKVNLVFDAFFFLLHICVSFSHVCKLWCYGYCRAGELTAAELDNLMVIVANPRQFKIPDWFLNRKKDYKDGKYSQVVSNALDMKLRDDLERLKKIRNHRGLRHYWGLRVRGQHTKTTGRRGKTVGVSKKR